MMILMAVLCLGADGKAPGLSGGRPPGAAQAVETRPKPGAAESRGAAAPGAAAQPRARTGPPLLPISGLAWAKVTPDLCLYRYPVGTTVPGCQEHIDQGLGYFYSYVWIEAVRSFETATRLDPECAMAWWCLGRGLEKHGPLAKHASKAFKQAGALRGGADAREQGIIRAALLERGLEPGAGDAEARKKAAIRAVDEVIALFPDDEEALFMRAQLGGGAGGFGGSVGGVPFYHSLLRVNPLHPGANHELVHFYETFRRPALGWEHAGRYTQSSPGLPHAFHMQAHLATRLGRWDRTTDLSWQAIVLEQAYHKSMNLKPADDHQYAHHMEILMVSLIHQGRFAEAREKLAEERRDGLKHHPVWLRLAAATGDDELAAEALEKLQKTDRPQAAHAGGMWCWRRDDIAGLRAHAEVLRQARQAGRADKANELRLLELLGLLACEEGDGKTGLTLLKRCVDRTKDDHQAHAWGNGSRHMESWGLGALRVGDRAVAREAFLEALAHDPGSATAALGLEALCAMESQPGQAARYRALAAKSWNKASALDFKRLGEWVRSKAAGRPGTLASAGG